MCTYYYCFLSPSSSTFENIVRVFHRNTDSNGYLSIDIWELIRRIIGIGREVASRSVQTFREEGSSLVMTV